jgi:IclR helix-turn-helix domain
MTAAATSPRPERPLKPRDFLDGPPQFRRPDLARRPREVYLVDAGEKSVFSLAARLVFRFLRICLPPEVQAKSREERCGVVSPSVKEIASGTGLSKSTVRRALRELVYKHGIQPWTSEGIRPPREGESIFCRKRQGGNKHTMYYVPKFADILAALADDPKVYSYESAKVKPGAKGKRFFQADPVPEVPDYYEEGKTKQEGKTKRDFSGIHRHHLLTPEEYKLWDAADMYERARREQVERKEARRAKAHESRQTAPGAEKGGEEDTSSQTAPAASTAPPAPSAEPIPAPKPIKDLAYSLSTGKKVTLAEMIAATRAEFPGVTDEAIMGAMRYTASKVDQVRSFKFWTVSVPQYFRELTERATVPPKPKREEWWRADDEETEKGPAP